MQGVLLIVEIVLALVVVIGLLVLVLRARKTDRDRIADELRYARRVAEAFEMDTTEIDRHLEAIGRKPR